VTQTHDPRSYELEQLASSDDTEPNSYTYWGSVATHGHVC